MDKIFTYTQLAARLSPELTEKIDQNYELLTGSSEPPLSHKDFVEKLVANTLENYKKRQSKKEDLQLIKKQEDQINNLQLEIEKLKSSIDVYKEEQQQYEEKLKNFNDKTTNLQSILEKTSETYAGLETENNQLRAELQQVVNDLKEFKENSKLPADSFIVEMNKFKQQVLEKFIEQAEVKKKMKEMNMDGKFDKCFDKIDTENKVQNYINFLFSHLIRNDIYRELRFDQVFSRAQLATAFNNFLKNE